MAIDPKKVRRIWNLPWDSGWVTSVTFLGAWNKVAAGNQYGQIMLWDLPDAMPDEEQIKAGDKDVDQGPVLHPKKMLSGHTNLCSGLAYSPSGKLVSTSWDHTVRVWDTNGKPTQKEKVTFFRERTKKALERAKVDKEVYEDREVDVQTDHQKLDAHTEWIRAMNTSRDNKLLVTGDDSGRIILWDFATMKEVKRLQGSAWVRSLAISDDHKQLIHTECGIRYTQFPNAIKHWNLETGESSDKLEKVLSSRNNPIALRASAFSPDGKLAAFGQLGESGGTVYLVDLTTGKKQKEFKQHQYGVTAVRFSSDGKYLLSSGRDTVVKIWDVASGKEVGEVNKPSGGQFKDWIHTFALTSDEKWIVLADMGGRAQVFQLSS